MDYGRGVQEATPGVEKGVGKVKSCLTPQPRQKLQGPESVDHGLSTWVEVGQPAQRGGDGGKKPCPKDKNWQGERARSV